MLFIFEITEDENGDEVQFNCKIDTDKAERTFAAILMVMNSDPKFAKLLEMAVKMFLEIPPPYSVLTAPPCE